MINFYNVGENKSFEENAGTDEASKLSFDNHNGDATEKYTDDNEDIASEASSLTSDDHNGCETENKTGDIEDIIKISIKTFVLVLIYYYSILFYYLIFKNIEFK